MDDPLNDSETDPRAIEVFLGVKTLKRRKHFLGEIGIESGAVIPNVQNAVTIASLSPNTTYIFEVVSVDGYGGVSNPSAPVSATTNAPTIAAPEATVASHRLRPADAPATTTAANTTMSGRIIVVTAASIHSRHGMTSRSQLSSVHSVPIETSSVMTLTSVPWNAQLSSGM